MSLSVYLYLQIHLLPLDQKPDIQWSLAELFTSQHHLLLLPIECDGKQKNESYQLLNDITLLLPSVS